MNAIRENQRQNKPLNTPVLSREEQRLVRSTQVDAKDPRQRLWDRFCATPNGSITLAMF